MCEYKIELVSCWKMHENCSEYYIVFLLLSLYLMIKWIEYFTLSDNNNEDLQDTTQISMMTTAEIADQNEHRGKHICMQHLP